ncbi:hypothetical protein A464_plas0006 (plasmid) [Salmonella bongori N268-08]|uniref:Uncharacterized protein n=1 Tax=Salmonella bongori N268-08 TaxID=1197719 RepID=S5NGR1_SALBN|nr:hypothetical protein A464_plas0006 [Salmonella bongori N268-08]
MDGKIKTGREPFGFSPSALRQNAVSSFLHGGVNCGFGFMTCPVMS